MSRNALDGYKQSKCCVGLLVVLSLYLGTCKRHDASILCLVLCRHITLFRRPCLYDQEIIGMIAFTAETLVLVDLQAKL